MGGDESAAADPGDPRSSDGVGERIDPDRGGRLVASILGWGALAVVLGCVLAWLLFAQADPARIARPEAFFGRTSLHTGASGIKAWYLLLQAHEVPVARRFEPLELFVPTGRPLLVLAAPSQAFAPSELRWIQRYVEDEGGAVLFAPWAVREGEYQVSPEGLELLDLMGLRLDVPVDVDPKAADALALREVELLELVTGTDHAPMLVTRGQAQLQWHGLPRDEALVISGDEAGMSAVAVPMGKGVFIVLSDLHPLTNLGIVRGDNAAFAVGLARAFAGPGGVLFDEYHHGVRTQQTLPQLLAGTPLGWLSVQVLLLFGLWLYAGAVRFGAPLRDETGRRRSGLEQVAAMANLYEQTGARRLVSRVLWRRFARRAWRLLGAQAAAGLHDEAALAIAIGRRLGEAPELSLRLARDALVENLSAAEIVRLDRHLDLILRRLEDVARTGYQPGAHPVQRALPGHRGTAGGA